MPTPRLKALKKHNIIHLMYIEMENGIHNAVVVVLLFVCLLACLLACLFVCLFVCLLCFWKPVKLCDKGHLLLIGFPFMLAFDWLPFYANAVKVRIDWLAQASV